MPDRLPVARDKHSTVDYRKQGNQGGGRGDRVCCST